MKKNMLELIQQILTMRGFARFAQLKNLHNLKNVKNTHEGVIPSVKLQAEPMGVFNVFGVQMVPHCAKKKKNTIRRSKQR